MRAKYNACDEDCTSDWRMTRMLAAAVVAVVFVFYDLDEVIICLMLCNPTEAIHSFFIVNASE
jgi:hypothetical protein